MKKNILKMKSPAKINYLLEIKGQRKDGYHDIETVFQTISFYDELIFSESSLDIVIETDEPELSNTKENLIYKAADLLLRKKGIKKGAHIQLKKNIPMGSGLGGGSSNAACTLRGLNKLWNLNISDEELVKYASHIGADASFFIRGGMAIGRGRGEKISTIRSGMKIKLPLLVVCPPFKVSTQQAYAKWDEDGYTSRGEGLDKFLRSLYRNDLRGIADNLYNDFEQMIIKECPLIQKIKDILIAHGALGTLMTGSGSAVYGVFKDDSKLDHMVENLSYLGKVVKAYTT